MLTNSWYAKWQRRHVVALTTVAGLIVSAVLLSLSSHMILDYLAVFQLRAQYPLESISERLSYEARSPHRQIVDSIEDPSWAPALRHLENLSDYKFVGDREYLLEQLHRLTVHQFVTEMGFGVSRLPPIRDGLAELLKSPHPVSVPLPALISFSQYPVVDGVLGESFPVREDLAFLHANGLLDLFSRSRNGYVVDRDRVAGFESHQMTRVPGFDEKRLQHTELKLSRLELISLYRNGEPVAYLSDQLPKMDRIGVLETRLLDEFERQGLDRLFTEAELVTEDSGHRIRMLGGIRARQECLQCHSAEIGELMGALSYQITRGEPQMEVAF